VLDGPFSEEFKDFVACCLVKAPAERPSAATLLRHPFITAVTGIPPAWTAFVQATVGCFLLGSCVHYLTNSVDCFPCDG
jgi:serine/threonine protein kinase